MNIEEHIQGIKTRRGLVREFTRLHRRIAALESREAEVGSNKPEIVTNIQEKASTIPDILYQLDEEGRIVFISKAIEAYGYTLDELIGRFMFELIHPTDRKKAKYCINERRSGERRTEALELRLLTKIRKVVPVEFRISAVEEFCVATVLIDAEGIYSSTPTAASVFLYTQGRAKDISECKVWEEEQQRQDDDLERRVADRTADLQAANFQLYCKIAHDKNAITEAQESEAWHRRLVELSPVAVLLFRAGEIVYANTLAAEFLGAATPDLLEGRLLRDFQIGREPTGGGMQLWSRVLCVWMAKKLM